MKFIKYFLSAVLLAAAIFLTAANTTLIDPDNAGLTTISVGVPSEGMKTYIEMVEAHAKTNNVTAFFHIPYAVSQYEREENYYVTAGGAQTVRDTIGIKTSKVRDLFSGEIRYAVPDMTGNADNIKSADLYCIGTDSAVESFAQAIEQSLQGEFKLTVTKPPDDRPADAKEILVILLWVVTITVIAVMTLYDVSTGKKEAFVRYTMGSSLPAKIALRFFVDAFIYTALCAVFCLVIHQFNTVTYAIPTIVKAMAILLAAILFMHATLALGSVRSVLTGAGNNRAILRISYGVKLLVVVAAILSFTSLAHIYQGSGDSFTLKNNVKYFEDYSTVDILNAYLEENSSDENSESSEDLDLSGKALNVGYQIYAENYAELKPVELTKYAATREGYWDETIITANANAAVYLEENFAPFAEANPTAEQPICIFIPDTLSETDRQNYLDIIYKNLKFMWDNPESHCQVVEYTAGEKIVYFNESETAGLAIMENPVLVYEISVPKLIYNEDKTEIKWNTLCGGSVLYSLNDEQVQALCEKYSLDAGVLSPTTVRAQFEHYWFLVRALLVSSAAVLVLMLMVGTLIIFTLVKLDFSLHSFEYCLKRTMGYSLTERYQVLIAKAFVLYTAGTGIALVVIRVLRLDDVPIFLPLLMGAFLLAAEIVITLAYVARVEHARITKILKGGAI